jgi:hypothetical protein
LSHLSAASFLGNRKGCPDGKICRGETFFALTNDAERGHLVRKNNAEELKKPVNLLPVFLFGVRNMR